MVSQKRLNEMLHEEFNRARYEADLDLEDTDYFEVYISNTKSCYGYNVKKYGRHEIHISSNYLNAPEEEIRTVICHEVCHSVKGSTGHDAVWRRAVKAMRSVYDYMNADYHLNLHPYGDSRRYAEHTTMESVITDYKYTLICTKCGYEFHYKRLTNAIKHPSNYKHTTCGGSLKLKEN